MSDSVREVERVFAAQKAQRWSVAKSSAEARIRKLRALKEALLRHRAAMAEAIYKDFRKNKAEFEFTEVHIVLEELNFAIERLPEWMSQERVKTPITLAGSRSSIAYEPKGQVLILAPWNYPMQLLFSPLVAALAAGNCVVLKPSHKTTHFSEVAKAIIEATFREDEVAIFLGGPEVADALLAQPFDHVFFTGSTQVGRKIMAEASKHLASTTLELGGKSPVIIDKSADLESAALRVMWGKNVNAGQTCVAPDYVLIEESVRDAFLAASQRAVSRFYGESEEARKASPDFARMIDDAAFHRVRKLAESSIAQGARVAWGGVFDESERYIAPTVLLDVVPTMPIMSEEIFGPILPIVSVRSVDDAVAFVQEREKPLALYHFSTDAKAREKVLTQTTSGGVVFNHVLVHLANPYLPFGGIGESGQGNYHGEWGFKAFSHQRAVFEQKLPTTAAMFYPPYGESKNAIGHAILKYFE